MARELPSITPALQSSLPAGIPISHLANTLTLLSQLEGLEQAQSESIGHFGPFQVLRALGEGGMGVVVLARDTRNDAVVAVKVLKPSLLQYPLAVQRFLSEANHMSRLKHPHILPVLDSGRTALGPYYSMPFCEKGGAGRRVGGRETGNG
ncbi:protein kinase domain-containing protein [Fontisphaera persica]|uniref:protein kinase domain-containing protein n=1 Tax=Fontisphaera persica TaxID=2974023 RepID=UPI003CCCFE38